MEESWIESKKKRQRRHRETDDAEEGRVEKAAEEEKRAGKRRKVVHGKSAGSLRFKSPSHNHKRTRTLESSFSEELFVRILSHLPLSDLINISLVSREWYRISYDSTLWRDLYLSTFATSRSLSHSRNRDRPWRDLYKISTNWRNGSAKISTQNAVREAVLPPPPSPRSALVGRDSDGRTNGNGREGRENTILQFYKDYYFITSRHLLTKNGSPGVEVRFGEKVIGEIVSTAVTEYWRERSTLGVEVGVTEMKMSVEGDVLAIFYSTGQFTLFSLHLPSSANATSFAYTELYTSLPQPSSSASSSFDPTLLSCLSPTLLVTLSESFLLRIYRLSLSPKLTIMELPSKFRSEGMYWPVVLTLSSSSSHDQLTLAYPTPLYPHHWTISLQRFLIPHNNEERRIELENTRARGGRKSLIRGLEMRGDWVVGSREDGTVDFWQVMKSESERAEEKERESPYRHPYALRQPVPTLELKHTKTLYGHHTSVYSLAVDMDERRCVSGGRDGGVRVWDLDGSEDEGVGVVSSDAAEEAGRGESRGVKRVWFDQEKIVSIVDDGEEGERGTGRERVRVLRFD